jgi:hypothetical protein
MGVMRSALTRLEQVLELGEVVSIGNGASVRMTSRSPVRISTTS